MIKIDDLQSIYDLKYTRAYVLRKILDTNKVVCFSCGTTIEPLRSNGFDVLYIGEHGDLKPNRWFSIHEIANIFPDRFDVTCGHLTFTIMAILASYYKSLLSGRINNSREYNLPTGSGETLICLKSAFPDIKFNAVYNLDECTEYHEEAPLNSLVKLVANKIILNPKEEDE